MKPELSELLGGGNVISIRDLCRTRKLSRMRVRNWVQGGLKMPDGSQLILRTAKEGKFLYTTEELFREFLRAYNDR
jgi:hypothetical protein